MILYKPFALIGDFIAKRISRSVFKGLWSKIDKADPPVPTAGDASLPKVVGAAALEAATKAGVGAAVDRATARAFHYLIGVWPGEKREKRT